MNVIRFNVEVEFKRKWSKRLVEKPWEPYDIKKHIVACLQASVPQPDEYLAGVQNAWNQRQEQILKGLFSPKYVVAKVSPQNINCFLFHEEPESTQNKDRITFVALIISDLGDFDHCLSIILNECRRLLPLCKIRVLGEHGVHLYLYDQSHKDILGDEFKIRATLSKTAVPIEEKWRVFGYSITGLICILLYKLSTASDLTKSIYIGFFSACCVFLLAEVIFRVVIPRFLFPKHPTIIVNDLSRIVAEIEAPFIVENGKPGLKNPTLPQ